MLDVAVLRSEFPALKAGTAFFDNPAGTQVPRRVTEAMTRYLLETNANHGGAFATSRRSDAVVAEARQAVADFLHGTPEEVVFGQNMTSLTFHVSRSLARLVAPGDEVVVTRLDHDANVAPWLLLAEDRGATVRWVDFDPADCTWSAEALAAQLSKRTRIVAVGMASNAVGTVNPVADACRLAREAGALSYVDAVHYAPHGPVDVAALGCDFLACSAYKFFGPHLGVLWGRRELLESLRAYKVRPSSPVPPEKWETGTQSFESIAGAAAALDYLASIGERFAARETAVLAETYSGRRRVFAAAMEAIRAHEATLTRALHEGLSSVPGLEVRGITDPGAFDRRVPTFSFTLEGHTPRAICEALDRDGITAWDGNYYALEVVERLGLEGSGGMVRVGAVHYTTPAEVDRLVASLRRISASE